MSYTDIIYGIGEGVDASFAILRALGTGFCGWFNWVLIVMGVIMIVWWMGQMKKYDKEAEQNGTMR